MVHVTVTGAAGRMGKSIVGAVRENRQTSLVGALEVADHPAVGKDAGDTAGISKVGVKVTTGPERAFKKADVIIDFSTPEASLANLEMAVEYGKAMVIGTTGLSHAQRDRVKDLAREAAVVMAPNMSVGVNLLLKLVEDTASILGDDYDIEIVDFHHRHKKDAPSGTALRIAEVAAHALKKDLDKVAVYERKGIIGERGDGEIGIQTVRAGDIVGDHTVIFAGPGERIELVHRAHSRSTFASGAVKAAVWVANKPAGLYDMQDVLGLK
ncbi:MAG: 4-hydroxy-tetrahydrodipicolinate reductase [Thermodesulfobacteriota bacterium]